MVRGGSSCTFELQRWRWLLPLLALAGSSASRQPASRRLAFELHRTSRRSQALSVRRLQTGPMQTTSEPSSDSIPLANMNDIQYHLQVHIGTLCPDAGILAMNQTFSLVPDTGSADLWVPAASCLTCMTTRYDSTKSCSSKVIGDHVKFHYGDGTRASGVGMSDTVRIGSVTVSNQFLIQVNTVDEKSNVPFGGILGLGHHRLGYSLDSSTRHTFVWSLFEEHPHLPRQFSFFLSGAKDSTPSQLILGEPDISSHAKEPIRYSKSGNAFGVDTWLASLWSIGFSGGGWVIDFPDEGANGVGALVDSGTSMIVLRPDIYDQIFGEVQKRLSGCGENGIGWACDCPEPNDPALPSLVLAFVDDVGGLFSLCMTPEEWMVEDTGFIGTPPRCIPQFQKGDNRQPTPIILGMAFMRSFYTTFDVSDQRIGFARSSASTVPAGMTCHIGYSFWRVINFEWVFFAGAFIFAILSGCLCGYHVCPHDDMEAPDDAMELLENAHMAQPGDESWKVSDEPEAEEEANSEWPCGL